MGGSFPHCWLCRHFKHDDRSCLKHEVYIPEVSGYPICRDFEDIKFGVHQQFEANRDRWFLDPNALYIYNESSPHPPKLIAFADLKGRE